MALVPVILPLSTQHLCHPHPLRPCLPQVSEHHWPVVVCLHENPPKIFERGDLGEGNPIFCERHLRNQPCLSLRQASPLPLCFLLAEVRLNVPPIEGLAQHKHATLGAPETGLVPFLQYHYCILCMELRKVNPEIDPIQSPSRAPLHQAPEPLQMFRDRD